MNKVSYSALAVMVSLFATGLGHECSTNREDAPLASGDDDRDSGIEVAIVDDVAVAVAGVIDDGIDDDGGIHCDCL